MSTTSGRPGFFITFEGGEGAGKSTQLRALGERLRGLGRAVVETAEPGGTAIGLQIRHVLLDPANHALTATAELLLMFAARAQNVEQVILPALDAGQVVLCDRFTDSTWAYQGIARGLGTDVVREIDRIACRGLVPDLTLYLDIDPELGLLRARSRNSRGAGAGESRLDDHALEFHREVRDAFLDLAHREAGRIKVIDAAAGPDEVARKVWGYVGPWVS